MKEPVVIDLPVTVLGPGKILGTTWIMVHHEDHVACLVSTETQLHTGDVRTFIWDNTELPKHRLVFYTPPPA